MRLIVDEMPLYKDDCPFYKGERWINDCTRVKHYCSISPDRTCDFEDGKCGCLKQESE